MSDHIFSTELVNTLSNNFLRHPGYRELWEVKRGGWSRHHRYRLSALRAFLADRCFKYAHMYSKCMCRSDGTRPRCVSARIPH